MRKQLSRTATLGVFRRPLDITDRIPLLIEHYGFLIVFFGVLLGSSGIPFPAAAILLGTGVVVHQGYLGLADAIVFGVLGAIIGNQIGYWAGRKGGRRFVLKWGRYVKITPERLGRVERFFVRYGGKAVFAARFFSVFRVLGGPVAGISGMRGSTFLFYSVLGGTVWATAVVLVGYFFGHGLSGAHHWSERTPFVLALVLVVALSFYLLYRWETSHRS